MLDNYRNNIHNTVPGPHSSTSSEFSGIYVSNEVSIFQLT